MSTIPEDQLLPESSPGSPSGGVRRVNNLPVYIVGGVMAVFLLIVALVAADRAKQQSKPAEQQQAKVGSTTMFAKELAGDRTDGIIQAQAATPPTIPQDLPAPGAADLAGRCGPGARPGRPVQQRTTQLAR